MRPYFNGSVMLHREWDKIYGALRTNQGLDNVITKYVLLKIHFQQQKQ